MRQLRLLLGLRYRLLVRSFGGSGALRTVGWVVVGLWVVVMATLFGSFAYRGTVAYLEQAPHLVGEWIGLLYLFVFVFLTTSTLFGFRGNELYDVTKLFILPVSHRVVFAATTIGLMGSGPVLFFLPVLALPLLPLGGGPAMVALRIAGLLLFLFLAVGIGQLLLYGLLNVLRGRRFRDLLVVAGAVLGGGVYLGLRFLMPAEMIFGDLPLLAAVETRPSERFALVPSVWIADVIGARGVPSASAFAGMALALPLAWLVVRAAAHLQERALHGAMDVAAPKAVPAGRRGAGRGAAFLRRVLAPDLRAVAGKEITLLRREPMVKTIMIQQAVFVLLPIGVAVFQGGDARVSVLEMTSYVPLALLLVEQILLMNMLGLEGPGLAHLLAMPVARRRMLVGKNLAHGAVFGTLNALIVTGVAVVGWRLDPSVGGAAFAAVLGRALGLGALGLVVVIALGNLFSFFAPTRLTGSGRSALGQQQAGREGCATMVVRLATFFVLLVTLAPVFVLFELPRWIPLGAWFPFAAVPIAVAYALGLYFGLLRLATSTFERREEELLAKLVRSED